MPSVVGCFAGILVVLTTVGLPAENWPAWRGPRGDGSSGETEIPIRWDGATGENIRWTTPLEATGHASPIVWDDRIFVVGCREDRQERTLTCLDRSGGKPLWTRVVVRSPLEPKHRLNSYASSTPATDGRLVYVSFLDRDQMLVAAYDFAGERRWLVRPGAFRSVHGYCSPPILFEDLVIVNGDHDGDGYLAALRRDDGRTVWKTPREGRTRSYCPPLIAQLAGRTQMVLSGSKHVAGYDPRDGRRHWFLAGPTEQFVASLVHNGELLFLTAGFPERHILAIRPDGTGEVTDTHVVWRTTKGCSYVPSPIASRDGRFFLVASDDGVASCFEAATGTRHWMERIGPHYSASPLRVGELVHFLSDEGRTTIIRPGERFEVVAENSLGENVYASPAASQGELVVRGEKRLFCIGTR